MKTIKTYESFNHRRYGNPWIAEVIPGTTKPDFSRKVGGYTGAYGKGEACTYPTPLRGNCTPSARRTIAAGRLSADTPGTKTGNSMKWIPGICVIELKGVS